MRYGFAIDHTRCIGCHACTVACKEENQVPLGVFRTWVKYIEKGEFPDTRRFFSVMRCNQCEDAPCMSICPTSALFRRDNGIVDFDSDACIGCKGCMQACPYDALYIDPQTQTAAKCNYCAHRVEKNLEPACVVVCPEQAIVSGDLDDDSSRLSKLIASQQTLVRKPELGTKPKVFYVGAQQASLSPEQLERGESYMFATTGGMTPTSGQAARVVYDVPHVERPWGWKVSGYLFTKAISAGALLAAAIGALQGRDYAGAGIVALVFLALTLVLLVADLKRPERFLYLFLRPNWESWLVKGAWVLMAFGALATLWLFADRSLLAIPAALSALAAAGYSALLFGQARGRTYWSSPWVLPHLLAAALIAGSASLALIEPDPSLVRLLQVGLACELLIRLFEFRRHTHDALSWISLIAGVLSPLTHAAYFPAEAAVMALGGVWLHEHLWVRAGQAEPLS